MKKILLLSLTTIALLLAPNISFGQTPLDLGLLDTYQAFTGVGAVTNHGEVFDGDAGTHNGIISGAGFLASNGYTGTLAQSLSQLAFDAKQNLILLYIHVSDVPVSNTHTPSFGGGETLFPGVYSIGGAGSIAGTLILDGQNDPNAFFIIKLEGALSVDASSSIFLSNGAQAANVYFVAEGPISVGANSVIKGTLMSHPGAVSIGTDCDIEGRLFSSEGAITIGAGTVASKPKGVNNIPVNCVGSCDSIPALDVLGSVKKFALFTSDGSVANAALSGVVGDIGSNNGPVTGIDPSTHLGFKHPSGGLVTAQAAVDLDYAYSQLIAIPNTVLGHAPAFGSGETLFTGVYSIAAAGSLAGTLVLDGNGDPNASFVFKFGGGFSVAAQAKVILKNGARRCNIFWIAEGAISMGTFSVMKGTLLAHDGACTMGANGNLEGRMLSTDGAIGFSTGVIYNDTLCPGNVTPVAHDQAVCSDGSPTQSLTAQATFNAVNGGIQWWDAAIGGNVVQNPTQVGPGTSTYWALYTNGNYQGAARTPVVVTINDCKIAIVKTGLFSDTNNDGCADVGETIDYTFAVTNEGTVSLSDIVVTDPLLAAQNPVVSIDYVSGDNGLTGVVGVLDLTETWIYTASYVLTQNDIDAGVLINQAAVKGAAPKITYPVASVPNTEDVTDLSDHTSVIGDDPTVTTVPQCP
ncbi:MAG: putative repeat protein (TIGR01451 family), partial [Planctomycetota bacterium]